VASGFFGKQVDVLEVAVVFGVVHAVADDEVVGDFEGDVVGLDGDEAALGFVEAGGDLEGGGLVLEHEAAEVGEGKAGVEDVFDEDDVLAFDGIVDVLDELDGSGGDAGAAVGGDGDEVEGGVDLDGAGEVGEEDGCAFEDADEDDGLALVVAGDLGADLGDAGGDLLSAKEDLHAGGVGEVELGCWRLAGDGGVGGHGTSVSRMGGEGKAGGLAPLYFEREARFMYPYIHLGSVTLGTFGLLLWVAAVAATVVLHRNFLRHGVDADALSVVAVVLISGIVGAKVWHELQDVRGLAADMRQIAVPGWAHAGEVVMGFLTWLRAGYAWFGGLLAGIAALIWQGREARFRGVTEGTLGERMGALRMLDLAAPAAAIGYGVGRIGCLTSGDGDYGIKTTLPWGVHMRPDALVPVYPAGALVQPTPVYELLFALAVFWVLWKLGERARPVGWLTGLYLVLSGVGRFLVEFVRINPKIYFGMSNAQVAALGSVVVGVVVMVWARRRQRAWVPVKVVAQEL